MKLLPIRVSRVVVALAAFCLYSSALAANKAGLTMPDFTKGDSIPAGAKHDGDLGPIAACGWMFCDKLVTSDARQVAITKVEKGSPADDLLMVGDVLLRCTRDRHVRFKMSRLS